MAVDYDIAILGGSAAAIRAAVTARGWNARVALVMPEKLPFEGNSLQVRAIHQVGQMAVRMRRAGQFGLDWQTDEPVPLSIDFAKVLRWVNGAIANTEAAYSPTLLATLGIDVIRDRGKFEGGSTPALVTSQRSLLARTYLIAPGSRSRIPDIEGLPVTGYLTEDTIYRLAKQELPPSAIAIGGAPTGIVLAQALNRFGVKVALVVRTERILPWEDVDAARLVQAQLEAEGVRVLAGKPAVQVKRIEDKKWVQAGDRAIDADEIVLVTGSVADLEEVNLEAIGVESRRQGIVVNRKLQTSNPRIYACGDALGGYGLDRLGMYEADIAVKNALFLPWWKVDYRAIPWTIECDPPLARVGLTEDQARRRYGEDVVVLREYFKTLLMAQIRDETTGMFKLILRGNGEILGGHAVGAQAGELIHPIVLAIARGLNIRAIASLTPASGTFAEIYDRLAMGWRQHWRDRHPRVQHWLDSFFDWRRS
jgi:pyruvate/2-oxoglutarate dehydrogenase complex dihydrolipoamide dehydrogenase (E3) component